MPTGTKAAPSPFTRAIGEVLRAAAEQSGISQSHIGRQRIGEAGFISQTHVGRFFMGKKGIDIDQLNNICEIVNLSVLEVIEEAEARLQAGNVTPIRPNVSVDLQTMELQEDKYAADVKNAAPNEEQRTP